MGNEIINHLMYADDLVIMAPSVAGLSKLLGICKLFGASHDIQFNSIQCLYSRISHPYKVVIHV